MASRAWTKLIDTQTKDVTSTDLMKLSQLMYIDPKAIREFEALQNLMQSVKILQTPGQNVFADSIKLATQTINNETASFKPSTIYDGETYASDYLVQILSLSVVASGGDTATMALSLADGSSTMILLKPTSVTAAAPLTYTPTDPIYITEDTYLNVTNAASVDGTTTVCAAIVARGGA